MPSKNKIFFIATLVVVLLDLLFMAIAWQFADRKMPIVDTGIGILVFWVFAYFLWLRK